MTLESLATVGLLVVSWIARSAVILVLALVALRLCERRSAALRHLLLLGGLVAALLVAPLSSLGVVAFVPADVASYPRAVAEWLSDARRPDPASSAMRRVPQLDIPLGDKPVNAERNYPARALGAFALVWLAGFGLLALRLAISRVSAARLLRRARPVPDAIVPQLRMSDELAAPATLGCWRPTVLLPTSASEWPAEQRAAVLAHELAHIARRDCLTTLLGDVACALYWINPLVWLVARRMTVERERACDDRALLTGLEPTQYGMLLLDIARGSHGDRAAPALLMMARPKELESRLLAIMRGAEVDRRSVSRRKMALVGFATVLLGTVAASRAAAVQPPQPPRGLEPDRRGDSVASPLSERVPRSVNAESLAAAVRATPMWNGPDSVLVRHLAGHLTPTSSDPEEMGDERAAWALSRGRGTLLVEPLLESLGDADWRVRAYAAWTLGMARERRAVPALIEALAHPIWRMRAMAASALAEIGDPIALPAMTRALSDEAWQVRVSAVAFVGAHARPDEATRLLTASLTDRHIAVRNAASNALASLSALSK